MVESWQALIMLHEEQLSVAMKADVTRKDYPQARGCPTCLVSLGDY